MENDSVTKTLTVAFLLCLVCSVLVSLSAVGLRQRQRDNKALDEKKNLLLVAGLLTDAKASREAILEAYRAVETRVIDFELGDYAPHIDPETYDQEKASRDPSQYHAIDPREDLAGIKTRARYGKIYFVREGEELSLIIIPVKGKGLWSTLYGLLALGPDANTVRGLGFYGHGETPGLGGEIDNPSWKDLWKGKRVYSEVGLPAIRVIKGRVDPDSPGAHHRVDGLTGATITSVGVENLVNYWSAEGRYGAFLAKLREEHGR